MFTAQITAQEIENAHLRISPFIHKTPVLTNKMLDELSGVSLFFKCENFQKVGAFKARGAMNAVLSLREAEKENGVATHSSGNHGQALAWAAAQQNMPAYIVMSSNSPSVKVNAVRGYGAEVIFCEPTLQAREETLAAVVRRTNAHVVHPYNDYRVIAGQATCAKELLTQVEDLDFIFAPVGGGGLLSGTALSALYFGGITKVFGCEPEMANDAFHSFAQGKIVPSVNPNTIADGLKTSLGDKTFPIIHELVEGIITVSDDEIVAAMRLVWERMKIIVEPSAAVSLAALLKAPPGLPKGEEPVKVGVIFTGGNLDLGELPF